MKKIILAVTVLFFSILYAQVRVGALKGASCIPCAYLAEEVVSIDGEELETEVYDDAEKLVPELLKNKIDIGFLPVNVAAKLYNSSNNSVLCAAVTCEGNIFLITKDNKLKDFKELENKTVYVAGKASAADYMFRYLLNKNGIQAYEENAVSENQPVVAADDAAAAAADDAVTENAAAAAVTESAAAAADDAVTESAAAAADTNSVVKLDFSMNAAAIISELISGKIEYAVVPEPYAFTAVSKDDSVVYAISFQKEYKELTRNSNYPLTVMVVSRQFAQNKTEVLNQFLKLYSEACDLTNKNPRNAAALCKKYNLGVSEAEAAAAVRSMNFVFVSGSDAKERIKAMLQIFLDYNSSSIGGKLPDDSFYY